MNKKRRVRIKEVIDKLLVLKNTLGIIADEEDESFSNMTEGLQASLIGEQSEEALEVLNEAVDSLEDIISDLESLL